MKKFLLLSSLILSLALTACWPDRKQASSEVIAVKIGQDDFEIPRDYFYKFIPVEKVNRDIYLAFAYPDFKPYSSHEKQNISRSNLVRFLVFDARQNVSMSALIEKLKSTFGLEYHAGEYLSLERWTAIPPDQKDNEMYVLKKNNQEIGYLMCKYKSQYIVNPQCSGNFIYSGTVWLEFGFSKTLLPHWLAIQEKSFALIHSFQSNSE